MINSPLPPPPSSSTTTLSPMSSNMTLNTTNTSINDKPLPQLPSPTTSTSTASASPHRWLANLRRRPVVKGGSDNNSLQKRAVLSSQAQDSREDVRRDSGLIATTPSLPATPVKTSNIEERTQGSAVQHPLPKLPALDTDADMFGPSSAQRTPVRTGHDSGTPTSMQSSPDGVPVEEFRGLTTQIPTSNLGELGSSERVNFSARGSMLLDGKRLASLAGGLSPKKTRRRDKSLVTLNETMSSAAPVSVPAPASVAPSTTHSRVASQVLSPDEVDSSYKVRAMYEYGTDNPADWAEDQRLIEEEGEDELASLRAQSPDRMRRKTSSRISSRSSIIERQPHELAGGIEDWENVDEGQVDRYGFIMPKDVRSGSSSAINALYDSPSGIQRVSSALQEASSSPRPKNTLRRRLSKAKSERSAATNNNPTLGFLGRQATQSNGSIALSQHTHLSAMSSAASPIRRATNRLPHNKQRRLLDEAGDMLTLPPGLADLAEKQDNGQAALSMKRKEWSREDKWRKMGRPILPSSNTAVTSISTTTKNHHRKRSSTTGTSNLKGGGMLFSFDPHDPKIASRTWKGIPDRWRASAWHSFLSHSHTHHDIGLPDPDLIAFFTSAQDLPCSDDVQIDCDVPRTINRHIMFRRRYRGGQRLLFRVLHAIALYAPDVGYVQGMAAIAATLLCYFDEEKAFVCMVRLWELRGLGKLFANGFGGLMGALEEFEKGWLGEGDVGRKLTDLGISPTAYGTRWYLTLFNYSIPFPAQLRVWDVFMLLGDAAHPLNNTAPTTTSSNGAPPAPSSGADSSKKEDFFWPATLAPLHATSAALIDATREILLDSDFENTMKVLTSWVPVKDEDLLMRVVGAEWKAHGGR